MRFSHFFVDRPIFAGVISIILTMVGAISYRALPISEFPEIAPPTIVVNATFSGASAEVIAQTVAAPIEQEINGVDNMIYVVSQSTGNGVVAINVVFKPGTDIDQAQVLVQNRVSIALPRLPEEVQRIGVTVKKSSPDLMLVIHLVSPDGSLDQQYISNYATHQYSRRHHARRRRRRHPGLRCARLFHAGLARSRQDAIARPDGKRRGRRLARRQRAGRGRLDQPAAREVARRLRNPGANARAALEHRSVQRHRGRDRSGRPRDARARHCPGRARLAGLHDQRLSRQQGRGRDRDLPAAGLECAFDRRRGPVHDGQAREGFPGRD